MIEHDPLEDKGKAKREENEVRPDFHNSSCLLFPKWRSKKKSLAEQKLGNVHTHFYFSFPFSF